MKNSTKYPTINLNKIRHYFGAMLVVALVMQTVTFSQSSLTPVNLGTAGDFVILAKTAISTTGTTQITGDIGVSPAASTFITGFGLIADATTTFSSSTLVTGKVYSASYTAPTPTKMTTAIGDMQTAYTNAAGRTSPDFTELYTGDVTGKTLKPGLYKWGTGVQISAAGVTISGSPTDVWIFQIAQNLTVANGAIVTLAGGALASNIFWQVAGQVSLGTTAAMKGIILCKTAIAMNTGATLNGRALAQTAVTLIANTLVKPASISSVKNGVLLQDFSLDQNYPNPFNPTTTISYSIPKQSLVELKVYDMLGREVSTLTSKEQGAGAYTVQFDGSYLSSGIYLYTIKAGEFSNSKKLILLK